MGQQQTLPASVISLSADAFDNNTELSAIHVEKDNTRYCDYDGVLYDKWYECLLRYPPAKEGDSYSVIEGTVSVGDNAFLSCKKLSEIILPYSIRSIGPQAFFMCSNLITVSVPSTMSNIGESAFHAVSRDFSLTIRMNFNTKEWAELQEMDYTQVYEEPASW